MFVRYLRFRFVSFTAFELLSAAGVPSFEWVRVQGVWRNGISATIAVRRGCTTQGDVETARQCRCNGGVGARLCRVRRDQPQQRNGVVFALRIPGCIEEERSQFTNSWTLVPIVNNRFWCGTVHFSARCLRAGFRPLLGRPGIGYGGYGDRCPDLPWVGDSGSMGMPSSGVGGPFPPHSPDGFERCWRRCFGQFPRDPTQPALGIACRTRKPSLKLHSS